MRAIELYESAASELAKKLPSLEKHDYNTIDKLMKNIAKKHSYLIFHQRTDASKYSQRTELQVKN